MGSNGVDRVRSLRKILSQLRGTNICTSSVRFAPSFVRQPNGPEYTQMVRNAPKHEFRSQRGQRVCSLQKIMTRLCGTNFCTSSARFASSFVRQPNSPECTQIVWVRSLRKIPTQLRGTNFCTSSARFPLSFVRKPNGPECTQMV